MANLGRAHGRVAGRYHARRRQARFQLGYLVLARIHLLSSRLCQCSAMPVFKWSVLPSCYPIMYDLVDNPDTRVTTRRAHLSHLKAHFPSD